MRDILLLLFTVSMSLLAVGRPLIGMLTFVGFGNLGPQSLTWGVARTFPHSQVIGLATIIGFSLTRDAKWFPREREAMIMLALWIVFAMSTLFALEPELARQKLVFVSKLFLMMFLCTAIVNTSERLQALVRTIALSLGFYAVKLGLFVLATGFREKAYGPEGTYLWGENVIGIALAVNVPLLVYLRRIERRRSLRLAAGVMALLSYPAVIGTFSRGAWLSLAAVSVVLIAESWRRVVAIAAVLSVVATAGLWHGSLVSDRLVARYDSLVNFEEDGSAQSRFWNWEFCRRVGLARPFGGGFELYSTEAYAEFYPEFLTRWPGKVWTCHSMWMVFLGEHGVLGFALGVALMGSCVCSLRRLSRTVRGRPTQITELARMLTASFVGFMTGGTFLDVAYHELLYQLVAIVIVAKAVWQRHSPPESVHEIVGDSGTSGRPEWVAS